MPGGVGINLSPHHSCFLLLSACLIKLPPANPCTHKPISPSSSCPFIFICSTKPSTLCSLYPPAFHGLYNKTHIAGSPAGKITLHVCFFLRVFVCTNSTTRDGVTRAGAACFILIKFPSSFLLPSCVPTCPRSKCQQNLGTWSGIWCHITQRTWIQKTSQHGELTWSAAKPAATH